MVCSSGDGGFGLELFRASERQIQIQNVQGLCTRDPAFRQMDFTYIDGLFVIDQLRPFLPRGGRLLALLAFMAFREASPI